METIGVTTLNFQVIYNELLQTDESSTVQPVRSVIWSFNPLPQTELTGPDAGRFLQKPIFPAIFIWKVQ